MNVIRHVKIKKFAFPLHGVYKYDAQVWTSIDGGKTFYHYGYGKYCETLKEARLYKKQVEADNPVEQK